MMGLRNLQIKQTIVDREHSFALEEFVDLKKRLETTDELLSNCSRGVDTASVELLHTLISILGKENKELHAQNSQLIDVVLPPANARRKFKQHSNCKIESMMHHNATKVAG
ncbi:hypothetical protein KSP39_PZI013987 [Platanthera zijinensis]|uniref:Uncharacterized protein n=1 Tax=Platanthera zijinensis TaxID=2320716 RepID=A0AAP0BDX3_9ASPA